MRTAKRTGIAALFAVFFALLLAGCLCLGLPAKREAQAAEAEIVDKENAVASVVASDGTTTYYKTLRAALSSAESGETVNVLKDTSDAVEGKIGALGGYDVWLQVANKSIDIVGVGENRTLTATDCDWALYVVSSGTAQYTLTVENLNIVCSGTARWPMEVANGNYEVTLNNVTLDNENAVSSEAGFTVGGVGSNTIVTIKNSEIITGDNGKAIRVLNPVKLTVDNSHLKGRAALYMQGAIKGSKGSAGSEVSVENGSVLESYAAAYSSGSEEFGTLVFEMSGVKVTVKDSEIVATAADGAQAQGVVFYSDFSIGDGNKLSEISVNFENTDITVTGDAVKEPQNFEVRLGTSYEELLEAAGGFKEEPEKMLSGGPMMGQALFSLHIPVMKTSSALTCFVKDPVAASPETACIRCGRCVEVCPGHVVPQMMMAAAERHDLALFEKLNGMECCECGCCTYICPAHRPLTQAFKEMRKAVMAERKKKA